MDRAMDGDPAALAVAASLVLVPAAVVLMFLRWRKGRAAPKGRSEAEACRILSIEIRAFRKHLAAGVESAATLIADMRQATGSEANLGYARRKTNHTLGLRFPDPNRWCGLAKEGGLDPRPFDDLAAAVRLTARTAVAWDTGKYDNTTRTAADLQDIERNLGRPLPLATICIQAAERSIPTVAVEPPR